MSRKAIVSIIKSAILLLLVFSINKGVAQIDPNTKLIVPPSPNAASLGVYGQIPVSLFSGLPEISIPIGKVANKDASVDISLNYHGGGVHPEHHPGWVGLGWDLNAGGVISRTVNLTADERWTANISQATNTGYLYNYKLADTAIWATPARLLWYYNPDSAGLFTLKEPPCPDEFNFNFGHYSGSFYLNHKGKWQVKSKEPLNIIVQAIVRDTFSLPKQIQYSSGRISNRLLKYVFYQFTLTTPDGTQYIFGGVREAIEFTRNGRFNPLSSYSTTSGGSDDGFFNIPTISTGDDNNNNITPTAWYLTKIITKNGEEINLTYEIGEATATQTANFSRMNFNLTTSGGTPVAGTNQQGFNYTSSVMNPRYLSKITTPNQTVNFFRSTTKEMKYSFVDHLDSASYYDDLLPDNGTGNSGQKIIDSVIRWKKLDSIIFLSNTTGLLNKYTFNYKDTSTSRLMLNSMQESGNNGLTKPAYIFGYDATSLPAYNASGSAINYFY